MNLKTIVVAIVFGIIISSCGNDEPKYSCNQEIDEWVKDYIDEIHSMTRAEWLETDADYSIAIYRAFTPEQRVGFWREKFQELKSLSWSKGEMLHIEGLEFFFENNLHLFGNEARTDEQLDEVELFLYKWIEKAKKEYAWTNDMIMSIIASGDKVVNTNGDVYEKSRMGAKYKSSSVGTVAPTKPNCNCHVKSSFTCSSHQACEKATCSDTNFGCGFFLLWDCDGLCEEP